MDTANWHNPQHEARNPHSLVAIFQVLAKLSPILGQRRIRQRETLYSWAFQPSDKLPDGATTQPGNLACLGSTGTRQRASGISRLGRYPWGCLEARMGDLPCNGAKPVHWNIFRGILVLPPPPPPSNGQIYENKIKIPPMRNKYTVSFGVRLSKAEFVELENAIAAYPGVHRNLVASTAISRFVRSGGVEQLAQSIEPQTKTPA